MALAIVENAKTQRPSVCNAAETLLVHRNRGRHVPHRPRTEVGGSRAGRRRCHTRDPRRSRGGAGHDEDYATEFLDLKLAVRVVDTLDDAIAHITRYGTGHSEAIVTNDRSRAADRFVAEVDAAAVLVNASTRFVDGEEFGFGAEIGISTQKLHARGPWASASSPPPSSSSGARARSVPSPRGQHD